jgi:hypothetical protein
MPLLGVVTFGTLNRRLGFHVEQMANETTSIQSIVEREKRLIKEASLTIPHSFSTCTYSLGHIRQNVYLCKTCNTPRGICAPCSVACHTDHDQVELFAKRNFRCDCPTCGLEHPCSLVGGGKKIVNEQNRYGKNFENGAEFCRCGREYDAKTERETMVQCLSCEVGTIYYQRRVAARSYDSLGLVPRVLRKPSRAHASPYRRRDCSYGQRLLNSRDE